MLRMVPAAAIVIAATAPVRAQSGAANTADAKQTADASSTDKSGYTLFNPTPAKLLREFSTDRPDITESPTTVDAGHFQLEFSFLEYGRDRSNGVNVDEFDVLPFNLKVGLLNNVDLQFVFSPYVNARMQLGSRAGGPSTDHRDGVGDFQTRLKINLWGNDGPSPTFGDTSFAFFPFLQVPTSSRALGSDHVEGGVILPFDANLPGKFDFGAEAEFDFVWDDAHRRYGFEFLHSATLHHSVAGPLSAYIEYAGVVPSGTSSTYRATFSSGLIYLLRENVQLDAGVLIGLNRAAEDLRLFTGFSVRY